MTKRIVAFVHGCILLSAFPAFAAPEPLEELISAKPAEAGLNITVPTGGCTNKSDFAVSTKPTPKGAASVEIRRLHPDTCKGNFPAGVKLLLTWGDLNLPAGTKLIIKNPIESEANPSPPPPKHQIKARNKGKRCHRSKRHRHRCKRIRGKRAAHGARIGHGSHIHRHHRHRHRAIRCP